LGTLPTKFKLYKYKKGKNMKKIASTIILIGSLLTMPFALGDDINGLITTHSSSDSNLYFGYGSVWTASAAQLAKARSDAYNACLADGNAQCSVPTSQADHCTFWGAGDWQPVPNQPRYMCISHPLGPVVTDSDGDGVPDDEDEFPNDPNESVDSDGDGVGDNGDAFPNDPNESADTDSDLVGDNADMCAATNMEATITVGDLDTGIDNIFFAASGCSIADLVGEVVSDCADSRNHGQFVSCAAKGFNSLKSSGVITGKEKGALQRAAAQSDLPSDEPTDPEPS
jgi:hypothetical protein